MTKLFAKLLKRTRLMHASQAYWRLFGTKLRPLIKELYHEHVTDPSPLDEPLENFTFKNREVRRLYNESSEAIKSLVEKYRQGELGLDDEDLDGEIDDDIDDVRAFLELEAEELAKEKAK